MECEAISVFGSWPILLPAFAVGFVCGAIWMHARIQPQLDALRARCDRHYAHDLERTVDEAVRAAEALDSVGGKIQ